MAVQIVAQAVALDPVDGDREEQQAEDERNAPAELYPDGQGALALEQDAFAPSPPEQCSSSPAISPGRNRRRSRGSSTR